METRSFWLKICIANFFVVSFLGFLMRLNIVYTVPFFNQKYVLDAHSHFAFYGWVTQCIYYLTACLLTERFHLSFRKYRILLITNLAASYGMLFSFFAGGYFWLSIIFSSIALFAGFFYCWVLFRDTEAISFPGKKWLRAGAVFATLSALGIIGIAFSAHKTGWEKFFQSSTYIYLHYQYNGFFIFSCIGLLVSRLKVTHKVSKLISISFYLLYVGCLLGFGLSLLWLKFSATIQIFFTLVSIVQLVGSLILIMALKSHLINLSYRHRFFVGVFSVAFLSKFFLQAASCVPSFQNFIFGERSAVIAYLHLILLCGVTVFLFWQILLKSQLKKLQIKPSIILVIFIVLNQFLLFAQCIIRYFQLNLQIWNIILLGIAMPIMLLAISLLVIQWLYPKFDSQARSHFLIK